ncbi:MAG: YicC/YloC family endoribonuclease [Tissierellia bacterium]|nr:YicC/YloC family endoribonuclease [Tissierellia bacterium]
MIKSMTGYGRGVSSNEILRITADIKSVNNKYLDIQVKMPYYLMFLEDKIKKIIKNRVSRGRVEVYIKDEKLSEAKSDIIVDKLIADRMKNALDELKKDIGINEEIKLEHILLNNEILEFRPKELDQDLVETIIYEAVTAAADGLLDMRKIEGEELYDSLKENIKSISEGVKIIEQRSPLMIEEYREKLRLRTEELIDDYSKYDEDKLNSEVVFFAERSDIEEEIVRIKSHIVQFTNNLNTEIAVGRKLDFITQEMNREINTISAKSNDLVIKDEVINIKSMIDKLKEQVQNIE